MTYRNLGSESGSVGITATAVYPENDDFKRINFNLRGHHSAVSIVAWNLEQTKLASCDLSGIIYVWVPNEERWSVELVNDRGIKVIFFISHLVFGFTAIYQFFFTSVRSIDYFFF